MKHMKLGMFDKKNYDTGAVLKGAASVPLSQVWFSMIFGVLIGGLVFLACLFFVLASLKDDDNPILLALTLLTCGGFVSFFLGMTLPHLVIFAKEIVKLKAEIQELKTRLEKDNPQ